MKEQHHSLEYVENNPDFSDSFESTSFQVCLSLSAESNDERQEERKRGCINRM